jgi:iron complex outermembrane receptor protein
MNRSLVACSVRAILYGIAGAGTCTVSGLAVAQGQADAAKESEELQEVVINAQPEFFRAVNASSAARFDLAISETPQAISVLTDDFMRTANVQTLDDAAKFVPGLDFRGPNGWGEPRTAFQVRGVNLSLSNGFKLDNYSFIFQGFMDMVGLERMEVVKGPAAVSYGQASYGGLVNLISKKPLSKHYSNTEVSYGSFETFNFKTDITGPLTEDGRLRFRAGVGYRDGDSFRDGEETDVLTAVPTLAWDLSDRTELSAIGYFQKAALVAGGALPVFQDVSGRYILPTDDLLPRSTFAGNSETNGSDNDIRSIVLRLRHDINDTTQVNAVATYSAANLQVRTSYSEPFRPTSLDPASPYYGLIGSYSQVLVDDNEYSNAELSLQKDFEAFSQTHKVFVLAGINTQKRWVGFAGHCNPAVNILDFDTSDFEGVFVSQAQAEAAAGDNAAHCYGFGIVDKRDDMNVGVQGHFNLTDRLSVLAGARYDSIDRYNLGSAGGLTYDFIRSTGTVSLDDTVNEVSMRLGAMFSFTDAINGYVSYMDGFTPQIGRIRTGGIVGNEHGELYEIGAKGVFLDGALGVNAAVFQLDTADTSVRDPNNLPGEEFVVPAGENERKGVELELVGQLSRSIAINANYAYIDGEYDKVPNNPLLEGKALPVGPNHEAAVFVNYTFNQAGPLQGANVGAAVAYSSSQLPRSPYLFPTFDVRYELPSFTTVDLSASYPLSDRAQMALNVTNLLDEEYWLPAASSYGVNYGRPRAYTVSFRMAL